MNGDSRVCCSSMWLTAVCVQIPASSAPMLLRAVLSVACIAGRGSWLSRPVAKLSSSTLPAASSLLTKPSPPPWPPWARAPPPKVSVMIWNEIILIKLKRQFLTFLQCPKIQFDVFPQVSQKVFALQNDTKFQKNEKNLQWKSKIVGIHSIILGLVNLSASFMDMGQFKTIL